MIVICEQCQTRFKLDETRIPPGGARVRCSRCKHAFFLPVPGDEPDLLDELISQTAATSDPEAAGLQDEGDGAASPRPSGEDAREGEWEFGEDLPGEDEVDEPVEEPPPLALDEGPPVEAEPSGLELASEAVEASLRAEPVEPSPEPSEPPSVAEPASELAEPPSSPPEPTTEAPAEPVQESAAAPELESEPQQEASAATAEELAIDGSGWDFDEEDEPSSPARSEPTEAPGFTPLARIQLRPASSVETPVRAEEPEQAESAPAFTPDLLEAPERVGRVLSAAGWLATAVIFGLVLVRLLTPAAQTTEEAAGQPLGPLVAESLEGRFVDNLYVGPLLVVTARLHNASDAEATLGAVPLAVLLDPDRTPLSDGRRPLAPVAERELRELPPGTLSRRLAARGRTTALRSIPPGDSVSVAAVFPAAPPDAWGLAVELGSRVRPPAPVATEPTSNGPVP